MSKQYYWHRFFSHQPDLNYDNPAVREEMWRVMEFWAGLGVDGFRVDAVPYLVEREGTTCEGMPETHEVIRFLRAQLDAHFPGRMLLAEANQVPELVRPYFGDGDEFHMAFHFPLMTRMFMAIRLEDRGPLTDIIRRTPALPDNCQWAVFLRNHDELTLEMVTPEEREFMYDEYARDPVARLNLGIRRRLAPLLDGDRRRVELMNGLLMSLPGSPIVYYGDEIGMGDNVYLGDRNGVRTPMQWSGGWNGGFSSADPERLAFAMISNPVYGYQAVNVLAQERTQPLAAQLDAPPDPRPPVHARVQPRHASRCSSRRTSACWPTCAPSRRNRCWWSTTSRARCRRSSSICRRSPAPFPSRCSGRACFRASARSRTC